MRLRSLGLLYDNALARNRLLTTTISGSVLALGGDATAQAGQSAASDQAVDTNRLAAFALFGGVLTGPINYVWLDTLERLAGRLAPAGGLRSLAAKVTLQSTVMQPFIYLPTFFAVTAVVRRWSPEQALLKVRADYVRTLQGLWIFWTPCVVYAFGRLPKRQQAVFFAGVGFAWNVVLSLISNPIAARLKQRVSGETCDSSVS